jgi:hypothetical protein
MSYTARRGRCSRRNEATSAALPQGFAG